MTNNPSPNGDNGGRDASGRFTKGNRGGTGNPYAKKTAELRSSLMKAVSKKDIQEIAVRLVKEAKAGNVRAADLLLMRIFGAPVAADVLAQLDELDNAINELARERDADEHSSSD